MELFRDKRNWWKTAKITSLLFGELTCYCHFNGYKTYGYFDRFSHTLLKRFSQLANIKKNPSSDNERTYWPIFKDYSHLKWRLKFPRHNIHVFYIHCHFAFAFSRYSHKTSNLNFFNKKGLNVIFINSVAITFRKTLF